MTVFSTRVGLIVRADGDRRFLVFDVEGRNLTPEPVGLAHAFRVLQAHREAITAPAE